MKEFIGRILDHRLLGLIAKETRHILRDKHLLFLLIFPPTVQLLLLGAALDPGVHAVKTGIVNSGNSPLSRRLVDSIRSDSNFRCEVFPATEQQLEREIQNGLIKVGVVIPADLETAVDDENARVTVLLDGTDAYTATIAGKCMEKRLRSFNYDATAGAEPPIDMKVETLFNPDCKASWYFIPGVLGAMLTLTSTLVASAAMLREKEHGTLEQLMMTPYSAFEIVIGKLVPIFVLLMADAVLGVATGMAVFGVPFRGSPVLFAIAAALYVVVGLGVGMALALLCKTERQAHLVSFFVIIPILQLSGSVVPYETMPSVLRALSAADPLRYFTTIARGLMLKGSTFDLLWQNYLMLAIAAAVLIVFSLCCFRRSPT